MDPGAGFPMPTYSGFASDLVAAFTEAWHMITWHDVTPSGLVSTVRLANCTIAEVVIAISCAFAWTGLRIFCTKTIFKKVMDSSGLKAQQANSVPECLWKLSFYLFAWITSAYLVLYKYQLFHDPVRTIIDWKMDADVAPDIRFVYICQSSFYIHSVYATIYLDKWRKDSIVLIFHHLISILLIAGSYAYRYTSLGLLVLFLHDLSDVILEGTKMAVYYKSVEGKWQSTFEIISSVGFVLFGTSWFLSRLYWFPLKAIYASVFMSRKMYSDFLPPFWFPLNFLLIFLFILHAYWFVFILEMFYRILMGKTNQVEDVREYAAENQQHVKSNGSAKMD